MLSIRAWLGFTSWRRREKHNTREGKKMKKTDTVTTVKIKKEIALQVRFILGTEFNNTANEASVVMMRSLVTNKPDSLLLSVTRDCFQRF